MFTKLIHFIRLFCKKIYDRVKLNLGIKTFFIQSKYDVKYLLNKKIIMPLHKRLENYLFKETIKHYGADYKWGDQKSQNLDKNTTNYGYGLFHHAIVRNQRPKRILCIGSMYGYIPYMLAKACEENGYGVVDFVDAGYSLKNDNDQKTHYFGQGFWNKNTIKKHFSYLLDTAYLETYIMTSEEFSKKYHKRKYDYIYLDGDHSYKGASLDIKLFWSRLNKEGFMCFHDIHLKKEFFKKEAQNVDLEFGYRVIWEELMGKHDFKFELSNHYSGLGFLQKL